MASTKDLFSSRKDTKLLFESWREFTTDNIIAESTQQINEQSRPESLADLLDAYEEQEKGPLAKLLDKEEELSPLEKLLDEPDAPRKKSTNVKVKVDNIPPRGQPHSHAGMVARENQGKTKMKLTKQQLKQVIKEEIYSLFEEESPQIKATGKKTKGGGRLKTSDDETMYQGSVRQAAQKRHQKRSEDPKTSGEYQNIEQPGSRKFIPGTGIVQLNPDGESSRIIVRHADMTQGDLDAMKTYNIEQEQERSPVQPGKGAGVKPAAIPPAETAQATAKGLNLGQAAVSKDASSITTGAGRSGTEKVYGSEEEARAAGQEQGVFSKLFGLDEQQFKQIVKEEFETVLNEGFFLSENLSLTDRNPGDAGGLGPTPWWQEKLEDVIAPRSRPGGPAREWDDARRQDPGEQSWEDLVRDIARGIPGSEPGEAKPRGYPFHDRAKHAQAEGPASSWEEAVEQNPAQGNEFLEDVARGFGDATDYVYKSLGDFLREARKRESENKRN